MIKMFVIIVLFNKVRYLYRLYQVFRPRLRLYIYYSVDNSTNIVRAFFHIFYDLCFAFNVNIKRMICVYLSIVQTVIGYAVLFIRVSLAILVFIL